MPIIEVKNTTCENTYTDTVDIQNTQQWRVKFVGIFLYNSVLKNR